MPNERVVPKLSDELYGLVYFLSHGNSGPIKIGFTADRNPESRIRQLQVGSPEPLELVGTVMAYATSEREIQTFLDPHRVRGEWFEREPALVLLARLQMDFSPRHRSDFVMELRSLPITRGTSNDNDEALVVRVARDLLGDWVDKLFRVNTEGPLPFRAWLHSQTDRKHPIGDLARDATSDPQFPATGALARYLKYIVDRADNPAVTHTLVDAWIECDMAVASLRFREQDVYDWNKDT